MSSLSQAMKSQPMLQQMTERREHNFVLNNEMVFYLQLRFDDSDFIR